VPAARNGGPVHRRATGGEKACLKIVATTFKATAVIADLSTKRKKEPKAPEQKASAPIEPVQSQLEELMRQKEESEKKAADYLDRLQRLQADIENLQKITKRQVETVTKQASEGVLLKLLPILDALRQATNIAHSNNQLPKEEIAVGLEMLLKQLTDVLRTEGLEEISAVGQQLDPSRHEVVNSVERDDISENTIIEEIQKGYILNGRVIRPSLVIVSKKNASKETNVEDAKEQ
jgi:molecular chaperone GrpE